MFARMKQISRNHVSHIKEFVDIYGFEREFEEITGKDIDDWDFEFDDIEIMEQILANDKHLWDLDYDDDRDDFIVKKYENKLYTVIQKFQGIEDGIRTTFDESTADKWINEFLDEHDFESWAEYKESRDGMDRHEIDCYVTLIE